jgi:hypothetical protein
MLMGISSNFRFLFVEKAKALPVIKRKRIIAINK